MTATELADTKSQCSLYINQAICVNTQQDLVSVVKEVIQPQVPLRLPCYDFTPVMNHTVVTADVRHLMEFFRTGCVQ